METDNQQDISKVPPQLQPHVFKKGQSGNPAGRPAGKSLKEYTREMLASMTDEERQAFLEGIPKEKLWEMAEGKPDTKTDLTSDGKPIQIVVPGAVAQSFNLNAGANTETRGVHPQQEEVQGSELG